MVEIGRKAALSDERRKWLTKKLQRRRLRRKLQQLKLKQEQERKKKPQLQLSRLSARMTASCLWAGSRKKRRTWTSRSTLGSMARLTTSTSRPTPTPDALVDLHSLSSR